MVAPCEERRERPEQLFWRFTEAESTPYERFGLVSSPVLVCFDDVRTDNA
jgi:hypothetical protein